jgi:hypothetical protein
MEAAGTPEELEVNNSIAVPMPTDVRWSLGMLWGTLLANLARAAWTEMSPAPTAAVFGWNLVSFFTFEFGLLALFLTPVFMGYGVTALALLSIARRTSWIRWLLLTGTVMAGAAFVLKTADSGTATAPLATRSLVYILMILTINATAVSLLFTKSSNIGFKRHTPD